MHDKRLILGTRLVKLGIILFVQLLQVIYILPRHLNDLVAFLNFALLVINDAFHVIDHFGVAGVQVGLRALQVHPR